MSQFLNKFLNRVKSIYSIIETLNRIHDRTLHDSWYQQIMQSQNPLNKAGASVFSQADEDGITFEILKRLEIKNGTFGEFGVGDGSQNNTLALIACGWKGFWIGGQPLFFQCKDNLKKFHFNKQWVDLENIVDLAKSSLRRLDCNSLDLISLDLDGNDIYFVEALLENGFSPKVFIVEYNGKFIPPIRFKITYNPAHVWAGDDYYGASLASFCEIFNRYGYSLVCCNAQTGVNAFFVRTEFMDKFSDVPKEISQLFCAPRFYQQYKRYAHKPSPRTIECLLSNNEES